MKSFGDIYCNIWFVPPSIKIEVHVFFNVVMTISIKLFFVFQRKMKKDPNAPKRPPTAYMQWLNENRSELKKENPGLSITELSKVAGQKWKTVDPKAKEVSLVGTCVFASTSYHKSTPLSDVLIDKFYFLRVNRDGERK